jgi:antibiotic biosynthesis monooxygenase (ABM) superfamily enzyme
MSPEELGAAGGDRRVTIVTQTQVRPEAGDAFARWQEETSKVISGFEGFIEQAVMPPAPPQQVDWVILQRFASKEAAASWLQSTERQKRLQGAASMLVGRDDVHLVQDGGAGALPAPVSVVISTRIKPGAEAAYRLWEQRIAAAQSKAEGIQGYRFEPPIPGVQDDFLAILRFDTQAHLQAWLDSPERQKLLEEASAFTQEFHTRIARTGFDQWFPAKAGAAPAPAWKMNMLTLLLLYPVVFLFGALVQTPLLIGRLGLPFAIALFIGNVAGIILLNYLVPWTSQRFDWWLYPAGQNQRRIELAGTALIVALYGVSMIAFTHYF